MFSPSRPLLDQPSFYIRPTNVDDASSVQAFIESRISTSLANTLDKVQSKARIESGLTGLQHDLILSLIAVCPNDRLAKMQATGNDTAKATAHTVRGSDPSNISSIASGIGGILAYGAILPYYYSSTAPRSCFDGAALMHFQVVDQDLVGSSLWTEMVSCLIDEIISATRIKHKYKEIIFKTPFHDNQLSLVALRKVFLDRGFEQVGLLRGVIMKRGILLDEAIFQRGI